MAWVLVVARCLAGAMGPLCTAEIHPELFARPTDCAEAAVVAHDALRHATEAEGGRLLALETRCLVVGPALFEGAL